LAVVNYNTGTLDFTGGICFAFGKEKGDVISGDYTQSGNAVIVAWDKEAGKTTYNAGTSEHIYNFPSAATAVWGKQGSNYGIAVTNGTNTGFIPVEGVTVEGVGIASTTLSNQIAVYPNPTSGELTIMNNEQLTMNSVEVYDMYGRKLFTNHYSLFTPDGVVLNISHFASGVYLLKIQTDGSAGSPTGSVVTKKIVKY
jgi:hypothetical protein